MVLGGNGTVGRVGPVVFEQLMECFSAIHVRRGDGKSDINRNIEGGPWQRVLET